MKKTILSLLTGFIAFNLLSVEKAFFSDIEKINLNTDNLLFSELSDIKMAPDGFVLLLDRNRECKLITTFDRINL